MMGNCQVRFLGEESTATYLSLPDKSQSRYRSFVIEGAGLELHSCSIGGKYLYVRVPKVGLVKIRSHRHLPDGAILKQLQFVKKNDGWFVNLRLEDSTIPVCPDDIIPAWENSLGMDAVLHEFDYLATSEGVKLPSLKVLRKSQHNLTSISQKRNARKRGSKSRRKLAKREGKQQQKIARCRCKISQTSAPDSHPTSAGNSQ